MYSVVFQRHIACNMCVACSNQNGNLEIEQCDAVCCSVLQCVAVCSSVQQCVAACCSVL